LTFASGTRFSIYEIVALLGRGGMGEVYRATDTRLHRDVAIKVLPAEVATDAERLARFEREARLLASLNHPNIAHVYGFESAALPDGSSAYFLAMELVEGEEHRLRDMGEARIALKDTSDGEFPEAESADPSVATAATPDRRRGILLLVASALIVAALAAGVTLWAVRRAGPTSPGLPTQTGLTRVTSDSGLTMDPAVSPTGSLLAYASDRGGASLNIWVQPLPTGQPVQITHGDADCHQPGFSPDGSRIVFRSEREGAAIYIVPALGGTERLVASKGHSPQFSPDGRRIAYGTGGRGSSEELWVVDEAGGAPRLLGTDLKNWSGLIWSPDGAAIVVVGSLKDADTTDWYRVDVANGSVSPMHAEPFRYLLDWPAATLLTTGGEGVHHNKLHAFDLATGKLRPIMTGTTGEFYGHGRISPDGRWMSAMEWTSAGRSRIIVFPFRETPVAPAEFIVVSDEDSVAEENAWSPDGQLLYFVSERDGSRCVWVRRLDPRTRQPVGPPTNGRELFFRSGDELLAVDVSPGRNFSAGKPVVLFSRSMPDDSSGRAYNFMADYDVSNDVRRFVFPKYKPNYSNTPRIRVKLDWFFELKRITTVGK
jgi:Tol biopolymer transport system component